MNADPTSANPTHADPTHDDPTHDDPTHDDPTHDDPTGDRVRVTLDREVCIGVGQCELLEPTVFELDEDEGTARLTGSARLTPGRAALVVDRCPSGAIGIAGEDRG